MSDEKMLYLNIPLPKPLLWAIENLVKLLKAGQIPKM